MAKSDLQTAQNKWQARIASMRSKGINEGVWKGLYQQDLANVQEGHSAMADAEVVDALRAAMGKSPLHDPHTSTGGPLDILGNIPSDIKGIFSGFIPGIASLPGQMEDLVKMYTGSTAEQNAIAKQYGLKYGSDIQDPGDLLSSISHMPFIGSLIPGVHTAAELTTSTGRKELEQHPIGTLLDILPFASEAGKVLAGPAEAGAAAADVSAEEAAAGARVAPATKDIFAPPSAREAFQQGHPVRGAVRAGADALQHIPVLKKAPSRTEVNRALLNMGIHPKLRQLTRGEFALGNRSTREMQSFIDGRLSQAMKSLDGREMDLLDRAMKSRAAPGERRSLLTDAEQREWDSSPKLQAIEQGVEEFNRTAEDFYPNELTRVPLEGGKPEGYVYAADSPTAIAYGKTLRAQQKAIESEGKLDRLTQERQARETALRGVETKTRRYLEPEEAFAAREAGPVSAEAIADDARQLVEPFRDGEPLQVFGQGLVDANLTDAASRTILNDIRVLSGEDGLFARWDKLMRSGDVRGANKVLTRINSLFSRHKSWERTPFGRNIIDHLTELKRANLQLRKRTRSHAAHARKHTNAMEREARQKDIVARRRSLADQYAEKFKETQYSEEPQSFDPILLPILKKQGVAWAEKKYATNQVELNKALEGIQSSESWKQYEAALGDKTEATREALAARQQWTVLAREGVDPVYIHNVDPNRLEHLTHTTVIPDRNYTPGFLKSNVFNFGSSVHSPYAAIVDYKRQMLEDAANHDFVTQYVSDWVSDRNAEEAKVRQAVAGKEHAEWVSSQAYVDREMAREWTGFDESGNEWLKKYLPASKSQDLVIPKGVARALKQMSGNEGIPLRGVWDGTLKVWKFSVLTTPRHFSHVAFGGAVMASGRYPLFFRNLGSSFRIVKANRETFLNDFGHIHDFNEDAIFDWAANRTHARWAAEAVGSPVKALNHLEEFISQAYKVSTMLEAERKGFSREEAIIEANKTIVGLSDMLPIERTLIRKIFPFYGFTRHLLRYVLTYPSDYPWRAAILSNLARMEQEDWKSGLPQTMQFLFWLGPTDPQTGKRTGVDYRSIDPFRSFYTDFTIGGVTSQLNPLFQFGLQEAGVDVLAGTPELYPNHHYDPGTGKVVADHPANPLFNLASTIIPELNSVDALVGLTDQYRHLKQTDPDGFKRMIYSQLGLPFAPETFDISKTIETTQMKKHRDAQDAIDSAIKTGNFADAKAYDYVPIPTQLRRFFANARFATPGDIEDVYNRLRASMDAAGRSDISVKSALPHYTPPKGR